MNLPQPRILIHQFLQAVRMRNCSQRTVDGWRYILNRFVSWMEERSIDCLSEITAEHLAAYRRSLFHYRNPRTDAPLKFETQAHYLIPVRRWFVWLVDSQFIEVDPAIDIELPKAEHRLPTTILTAEQVEELLNLPDVGTALGLRDRTILETFYSSAIRCGELIALDVYDIDTQREVVTVRRGKGKKDRVVPIGQRCLTWIEKWTHDVRPELVNESSAQALFVSKNGKRLGPNYVSNLVRRYMERIGITQRGSCHLLRHTAVTLMLENGADLRSLQLLLGHARLSTTQIYTHVSIQRLQEVHRKTHPAKPNELTTPVEKETGATEDTNRAEPPQPELPQPEPQGVSRRLSTLGCHGVSGDQRENDSATEPPQSEPLGVSRRLSTLGCHRVNGDQRENDSATERQEEKNEEEKNG